MSHDRIVQVICGKKDEKKGIDLGDGSVKIDFDVYDICYLKLI